MAHEAAAAVKALRAQLTTLDCYSESAPQDAVLPYVVIRQRSPGSDAQVLPDKRAMTNPLYDAGIWVADDPHSDVAQAGAKEIDEALGALAHYSVTDANLDIWEVSSRSEGGAWIREEVDIKTGKKYYWIGRSYRLSISQQ